TRHQAWAIGCRRNRSRTLGPGSHGRGAKESVSRIHSIASRRHCERWSKLSSSQNKFLSISATAYTKLKPAKCYADCQWNESRFILSPLTNPGAVITDRFFSCVISIENPLQDPFAVASLQWWTGT